MYLPLAQLHHQFWKNIALSLPKRRTKKIVGFTFLVFLCAFSLIPLFPIASLANLTAVRFSTKFASICPSHTNCYSSLDQALYPL
jgi:hypothetical protein